MSFTNILGACQRIGRHAALQSGKVDEVAFLVLELETWQKAVALFTTVGWTGTQKDC